LASPAGDQE
jgi:hypothetical protein